MSLGGMMAGEAGKRIGLRPHVVDGLHVVVMFTILTLPLTACGQEPSSYDPSKAPLLSEEKRREIDITLANEVATWNRNSAMFPYAPGFEPFIRREAYFRRLASEGYEVADIVEKIFRPSRGGIVKDQAAYERLHKLADAGDRSALCFSAYLLPYMPYPSWPYTYATEAEHVKRGVALGLPLCKLVEGILYREGAWGYPKDLTLSDERMHDAARAGLYKAQSYLFFEYEKLGLGDLHTIRKALCWGRLAEHHSPAAGLSGYTDKLKTASWDSNHNLTRPEFMQLALAWDLRHTPYETKSTTPEDCIRIEQESRS